MKSFLKLNDSFVLPSPKKNTLIIVDQIGRFILESLDEQIQEDVISQDISEAFSIPLDQAKIDVALFLKNYNKKIISPKPFDYSLKTRKDSKKTFCKNSKLIIFPSFSLRVNYNNEDEISILWALLSHLKIKKCTLQVADYNLTIAKNNKQLWQVTLENDILVSSEKLENIIIPALSHVLELAIRKDNYLVLLHASGVSYKNTSIIFPAIGGSGKSTLCAALIKNGFSYINDDVIPVDYKTGNLISIPFCIGVKQGSWKVLEKYYSNIQQLHTFGKNNLNIKYLPPPKASQFNKIHRPKFLVIPSYNKGSECIIEKVTPIDGLKAIIEGESLLKLPLDNNSIKRLIVWIEGLECYKLKYDNLDDACHTLKETLFRM